MAAYEWKPSAAGAYAKVPPQVVGEEVERIAGDSGSCPPSALVDAARPEMSPLHPMFEWRDDVAAEKWRTWAARDVLRHLVVVADGATVEDSPPAFISVTVGQQRGHVPLARVMSDDDLRSQAVRECVTQLRQIQRRHRLLVAAEPRLALVWDAIDALPFTDATGAPLESWPRDRPMLGCRDCGWFGGDITALTLHAADAHDRLPVKAERVPLTEDARTDRLRGVSA